MDCDGDKKIRADLVLDDSVPDILCKFAHRLCIRVIFLVSGCTGPFQNGLQLVLYSFKSSEVVSAWVPACNILTQHTQIRSSFV